MIKVGCGWLLSFLIFETIVGDPPRSARVLPVLLLLSDPLFGLIHQFLKTDIAVLCFRLMQQLPVQVHQRLALRHVRLDDFQGRILFYLYLVALALRGGRRPFRCAPPYALQNGLNKLILVKSVFTF